MIQPGVADSIVVHLELVDAPHVGHLEHGLVGAVGAALQRGAHERVDAHELQLHVGSLERLPLALLQLFDLDSVYLGIFWKIIIGDKKMVSIQTPPPMNICEIGDVAEALPAPYYCLCYRTQILN